jgi:integrase/recombinase XerD
MKTTPIPCSKEEIEMILKAAEDNDFYYTLFMVAKTTGRRLGEYWNVKVSDINFETNIMMTIVLKRRAAVQKEAILTPDIARLLKQYISRNGLKDNDYLFRKVGYRQIQYAISNYSKKAGVPHKVSFHNFRHYFITELVRKGWHYDKIIKLTGHSTPGTLTHYDHAVASDIKAEALEALEDI